MDMGDNDEGDLSGFNEAPVQKPRVLPDDLPRSLDDRKPVPQYTGGEEMYEGWSGKEFLPAQII